MINISDVIVCVMASWDWIREYLGPNAGEGVQAMQAATGNAPPDSWCCSAVCKAIKHVCKFFGLTIPVRLSGACEEMRQDYLRQGKLVTKVVEAGVGYQGFTVATLANNVKHAHHTFLVLKKLADGVVTVEGNAANPKGAQSSDGNGLYVGRVRGNQNPVTYNGLTFQPDSREYHFGNLPALLDHQ